MWYFKLPDRQVKAEHIRQWIDNVGRNRQFAEPDPYCSIIKCFGLLIDINIFNR